MANNDNIIYAKFNHGHEITTDSRSQYAYGQVLRISGLHLPVSFDADVSNKGDKQAKAVIGTENELPIDDAYFLSGKDVIVMINVHAADKDGRTKYIIRIPVEKRPERADIELEPVEQDVISTAIATLNEAIEQTSANAENAENSANRAQQSAIDAETSATNASNSEALVQQYMERAETAAENAEQSETKAKTSEDNAKASEEHAEQIASDIEHFTERAETASTRAESSASIASQYATSASNSANIATVKASEASASAENASRSAINATGQATVATQKAELAELHATNASNSASEANRYERMAQSEAQSASQAASAATTARDEARTARNQAQTAKTQAETAKTQAQTANTNAQSAATRASTSATSASQSATSAEESAQSALASKTAIENMSVTAQTLNPNQQATATKEVDSETGAITINYGIPKGVKGDTGEQGIQGEKGDTGNSGVYVGSTDPEDETVDVWVDDSGDPDAIVEDVQINGSSIVTDGVANIPIVNSREQVGGMVAKTPLWSGITFTDSGAYLTLASNALIKGGTDNSRTSLINQQHLATFYGLAKAAGHDEKDSTLPVGQYTDSAQTAIKQMLGVKDDYDSLVVEVSGTDPVITGKASYRYNCGELYTLSITPPETGTMDIIFTSGATPTVLTLPNTVKMPIWWAGIETNTTYEMCITDGVYCGVMSWAT